MNNKMLLTFVAALVALSVFVAAKEVVQRPKYVTYKKTVGQRITELDRQIDELTKQLKLGQELKMALSLRRDELQRVGDVDQTMVFVLENDGNTTIPVVDIRPPSVRDRDALTSVTASH
jgi:hypothetical protein